MGSHYSPDSRCCAVPLWLSPLLEHQLTAAIIEPVAVGGDGPGLLAPTAPLGAFVDDTQPSTLGRMADNDVSLLALVGGKGVVADDDARPDRVALVLGHDAWGDPRIIAGGDQYLP